MSEKNRRRAESFLSRVSNDESWIDAGSEYAKAELTRLLDSLTESVSPVTYDPVNDEAKTFTLREWARLMGDMAKEYADAFDHPRASEFMRGRHTFHEWRRSFSEWSSW